MKTDGDILMQKRKDAKKEPPRFLGFFIRRGNIWLALVLLVANLAAWVSVASRVNLVEAAPILHPEIAEIRAHWQARDAVGETFSVVVTDQMAMETLAWFIAPRVWPVVQPVDWSAPPAAHLGKCLSAGPVPR